MQNNSTPNLNFSPINNIDNKSKQLSFDFVMELTDFRVVETKIDPDVFKPLFNINASKRIDNALPGVIIPDQIKFNGLSKSYKFFLVLEEFIFVKRPVSVNNSVLLVQLEICF
jgi:hypothetical protein